MRERNRQYYASRFQKYGDDVKSLWGSKESQEVRFSVLCRIGELAGATILDVGCGFGDFYGYLAKRRVILGDYLGIDCVEDMLAVARKRHPDARFENWDLSEVADSMKLDWVFGSGLFTLTGSEWSEYLVQTVRKMFSLAKRGVGVNFLSSLTGRPDGFSHYTHPAETLQLLTSEICTSFELIHSYRPNDYTVFLYHGYSRGDDR